MADVDPNARSVPIRSRRRYFCPFLIHNGMKFHRGRPSYVSPSWPEAPPNPFNLPEVTLWLLGVVYPAIPFVFESVIAAAAKRPREACSERLSKSATPLKDPLLHLKGRNSQNLVALVHKKMRSKDRVTAKILLLLATKSADFTTGFDRSPCFSLLRFESGLLNAIGMTDQQLSDNLPASASR
ncbi:hypothetical protein EVAR_390_1 [Eumeta japonica]|uniref:Uncharacterized protein n=1 Tax=Eumeta variegata TaxID=151549 RepID=A0A4C1S9Z8_EUMVA|nr:hypothetical protein EVAR_390_1 [Eumeta japonica]